MYAPSALKIARSRPRSRSGFTLLEIMLVVGIIIILMGGAIFLLRDPGEQAKIVRAESDINTIRTQLKSFEMMGMRYPTPQEGLNALVTRPANISRWSQAFNEVPKDPWGVEYQYRYPAQKSEKDQFDLYSNGPDREPGTEDDIGNW